MSFRTPSVTKLERGIRVTSSPRPSDHSGLYTPRPTHLSGKSGSCQPSRRLAKVLRLSLKVLLCMWHSPILRPTMQPSSNLEGDRCSTTHARVSLTNDATGSNANQLLSIGRKPLGMVSSNSSPRCVLVKRVVAPKLGDEVISPHAANWEGLLASMPVDRSLDVDSALDVYSAR